MNAVTVAGNLGDDPELRYTPNGQAVANLNIAVERRYQKGGEWVGETSWFRVQIWGQLAENVAESLVKGHRVIVTGRLQQRSWETSEGEKRSAIEIVADEIGPSLKWATVSGIEKTRSQGSGGSQWEN